MAKNSQHVIPDPNGGWNVKRSDATRASKHFDNQQDAINWAKTLSLNQHVELVIHRFDGTVQTKDSYSHDPVPSRNRDVHRL